MYQCAFKTNVEEEICLMSSFENKFIKNLFAKIYVLYKLKPESIYTFYHERTDFAEEHYYTSCDSARVEFPQSSAVKPCDIGENQGGIYGIHSQEIARSLHFRSHKVQDLGMS